MVEELANLFTWQCLKHLADHELAARPAKLNLLTFLRTRIAKGKRKNSGTSPSMMPLFFRASSCGRRAISFFNRLRIRTAGREGEEGQTEAFMSVLGERYLIRAKELSQRHSLKYM